MVNIYILPFGVGVVSSKKEQICMGEKEAKDKNSKRSVLYEHWKKIPAKAFVDVSKKTMKSHPCRTAILDILREGVVDHRERRRHAMNAKEIRGKLIERGIDLSINALYFHLNVLEENELILTVANILEGRHRVAYFGRVARYIFSQDPENRFQKYKSLFSQLSQLLEKLEGPGSTPNPKNLADMYLTMKQKREEVMADWLIDHEEIVISNDFSMNTLFEALKIIDVVSSEHSTTVLNISEELGIHPDAIS